MSRIIVVGGTGTIGSAVVDELSGEHEVVAVGNSSGDYQVDLADEASIEALFEEVGSFDHLVSAAGLAKFGALDELSHDDFMVGFNNKAMGQIDLVRHGTRSVADGGSFTLTSGILATEPTEGSAAISACNAALHGFVRAAALELDGVRVNVVSPGWVAETLDQMGRDPSDGTPAARVARAYRESIESDQTGEIISAVDPG